MLRPALAQDKPAPSAPLGASAQPGAQTGAQTRLAGEAPVHAEAERITGDIEDTVTLEGKARLQKADSAIEADTIRYTQSDDEVHAIGTVRVERGGDVFTGRELRLRLDARRGYFLGPEYTRAGSDARAGAARIDFLGPERIELTDATYTTCTVENLDWYIQADSITLDEATQVGTGRNAVLYFKGVPIMGTPWLTFPLSDERKSGLLPPTFSLTSRGGAEIAVPYYWNIAPNRDVTFYPRIISRRGLQLGGWARYLEPTYGGDVRAEFLPEDRQIRSSRYSFAALHNWGRGNWSGYWNVNKVSDDNYFVDFSRNISAASQRILPRDAALTWTSDSGFWSATARISRYQTLQDFANPIVEPYEKLPQLALRGERLDMGGFDVAMYADATHFRHPTLVDGTRSLLTSSISYPYVTPGYFIKPKLSLHGSHYSLGNTLPGNPDSLHRFLPTASVDAGLIFERDSSLFGRALRQTLEPRLFYVRTPFRDQSQFPIFDTGLTDFSFAQMFSENPFGGADRIADANQVTAAVVSRFLDPQTGAERLRFALGQRFYLSPQRVTLPVAAPISQRASDFLATLSAAVLPGIGIESGIQYNQAQHNVVRANWNVRWQPRAGQVLNLGYRYLRNTLDQTDVSAQWPLGGGWHGVARVNYSWLEKRVVETLGGLEYNACCWVMRVVAQRFATATGKATTSLFLQLELNGFSRIGTDPIDALRRSIPGYHELNSGPTGVSPASSFRRYE